MRKSIKISLIIVSIFAALILLAVGIFFLLIEPKVNILGAPNLDLNNLTSYSRTVRIVDKNGNNIDEAAFYDNNKIYVRFSDLDSKTVNAFISIEDKRFYEHKGVDYKRMVSAAVSNIKSRSFREGASTITQQLIKNTHLSNEKTIKRKINEMRLARALERVYSKDH
ncbi:MAG: transglycosylase domain-containing protein, partial [Clostridiales bacterium]|nr:transglycosylase domain-containing protein [Clostridiales bacterium]